MKNKNYVSSKTVQMILAGMVVLGFANADACQVSNKVLEDTIKLGQLIKEEISEGIAESELHKTLKMDTVNTPLMAKMNGVAMITGKALGLEKMTTDKSYGSSVIVSSCVTITSAHVIGKALGKDEEHQYDINNGDRIFMSVGQTCDANQQFIAKDIGGKVVMTTADAGRLQDDWTVVVLDRKVPQSINPVRLPKNPLAKNAALVQVGFPLLNQEQDSFKHLSAQYINVTSVMDAPVRKTSDEKKGLGRSGGPAFEMDEKNNVIQPEWKGLTTSKGHIIDAKYIMDQIELRNPALYAKIIKNECAN